MNLKRNLCFCDFDKGAGFGPVGGIRSKLELLGGKRERACGDKKYGEPNRGGP